MSALCLLQPYTPLECFSYDSYYRDTLFRCASSICSLVLGGGWGGGRWAHLVFLFPRESLERTRLKFSLQGGKVTALCLQEGEQVWALNIKRALLSMLQTSPLVAKFREETEVSGRSLSLNWFTFSQTSPQFTGIWQIPISVALKRKLLMYVCLHTCKYLITLESYLQVTF